METTQSRYEDFLKIRVLPEVLTHHLGRHDDLPALTQYVATEKSWKTLTYRELYERVQRWRKAFANSIWKRVTGGHAFAQLHRCHLL